MLASCSIAEPWFETVEFFAVKILSLIIVNNHPERGQGTRPVKGPMRICVQSMIVYPTCVSVRVKVPQMIVEDLALPML